MLGAVGPGSAGIREIKTCNISYIFFPLARTACYIPCALRPGVSRVAIPTTVIQDIRPLGGASGTQPDLPDRYPIARLYSASRIA